MVELTGIVKGTGAKMKVGITDAGVTFRGAFKASAAFADVEAEARGTLLVLRYKDHVVEVSAGGKASSLASRINHA